MEYFYILLGLAMLFFGGEFLVEGASSIAYRLRISSAIVGVVIVGFGTSTPELLVSIQSAIKDVPALAVGNVVGSNIANIALILGVCAAISPIIVRNVPALKRDTVVMLLATLFLYGIAIFYGTITRFIAIIMLVSLGIYLYKVYQIEKTITGDDDIDETIAEDIPLLMNLVKVVGGIGILMLGADFLIDNGVLIARQFGISEAVIGLTIVAIGTSLPELAAGIAAVLKRESEILIGNIVGSNVFNILSILGVTALIKPFSIDPRFLEIDIPFAVLSALSVAILIFMKLPVSRFIGAVYLGGYGLYTYSMLP